MLRATWQAKYGDIQMDHFVWIGESSVDDRTNQRVNGWASLGRVPVRWAMFIWGQRYSVLPALSVDGIIALDIFKGSVTKEKFLSFLKNQLVSLAQDNFLLTNIKIFIGCKTDTISWSLKCCCTQ